MSRQPTRFSTQSPRAAEFFRQTSGFARSPRATNLMAVSAVLVLIQRESGVPFEELVDVRLFATAAPPDFTATYEATARAAFFRGKFDCNGLTDTLEELDTPFEAAACVALLLKDVKSSKRAEVLVQLMETVAARVAGGGKG